MSSRTTRRDRRNAEHGYTWINPERARHEAIVRARRFLHTVRTGALWHSLATLTRNVDDARQVIADFRAGLIKPPLEQHARETWYTEPEENRP